MYEKPNAPRGIGGVLDDGLRLWRLSLPLTWVLALMAQAVNSTPSILFPPPPLASQAGLNLSQRLMAAMGQSSRHALLTFALGLVSYVFVNAVMVRINSVAEDREISFSEAVATGFGFTFRVWWFFILLVLPVFAMGIIFALFGAAAGRGSVAASILLSLLAIAAVIFILYAAIKITVGYPAMITDDVPAWSAIKTSWALTAGFWWRTGVILTVLGVIALVLYFVLGIIAGLMLGVFGVGSRTSVIVIQLIQIVGYSVLGSLTPAVVLAIYNDLKLRKEGDDLADRVSALASR